MDQLADQKVLILSENAEKRIREQGEGKIGNAKTENEETGTWVRYKFWECNWSGEYAVMTLQGEDESEVETDESR